MKKKIFTAIILLTFFAISTYAAEITDDFSVNVNLNNEQRTIEINGYIYGFDNVIMTASLTYLGPTDAYLENKNGELYAVEQRATDEDGNYEFDLKLTKEAPIGWYKTFISGAFDIVGDDNDFIQYLFYLDEEVLRETIDDINSCTDKTLLSEIFKNNPYLGCENDMEICGIFLNLMAEKGDFDVNSSISELREQLNDRIALADIINKINKKIDISKQVEKFMQICGYSKDDIKIYVASVGKSFVQTDNSFENFEEIEEFLKKSFILAKINNATYETMSAVIEENAEDIELDLSGYNKLNKIEVNKLITRKNFANIEDFKIAFNEAVKKIEDKKTNSPTSGGGGGGGGNKVVEGKKPSISAVITPITTPIIPQDSEDNKTHKFTDIGTVTWAEKSIVNLYEKGIITGKSETSFCPEDAVTREEFVTLLVRAFDYYAVNATAEFTDVNKNSWFTPYIASAYNIGIVSGKGDGNFGIGESISREDAAVMLFRAVILKGINVNEKFELKFQDFNKVADYAKKAVSSLTAAGIINGVSDTEFNPSGITTRAQAVVLIDRILCQEG